MTNDDDEENNGKKPKKKKEVEKDQKQSEEVKQSDKGRDHVTKRNKRLKRDDDKKENEAENEVNENDRKQSDEVKQSDEGKDHVTKRKKSKREVADSGAASVEKVKKKKVLYADKKENDAEKEENADEVHENDRKKSDKVKQSDEVKDNVTKKSKKEVADNGDNCVKKKKVLDADKNEAEKEEKPNKVNENVVELVTEENSEEDFESHKRPVRKSTRIAEGRASRQLLVDDIIKRRSKSKQERKKLVKAFIRDEAPETNRIPTGYYGPHTGENTPTIRAEQIEVTREEFWSESSESEKNVDDRHVFKRNRIESDDDTDAGFFLGDEALSANINTIVASLSDSDDLDMSLLNTTPPEPKRAIGIGRKKIRKTADGLVEYDTELNKELEKFEKDAKNIRSKAGIYSDNEEDECAETKNYGTNNEKTERVEFKPDENVEDKNNKKNKEDNEKKAEQSNDAEANSVSNKEKTGKTGKNCDETKHDEIK